MSPTKVLPFAGLGSTMLLAGSLVPPGAPAPAAAADATQLISTSDPIQAVIKTVTTADVRYTWRAGCPVAPARLRKVEMNYRRYDGTIKRGVLIVRASHASAVAAIFRDAYRNGFRINRMDNPNLWYGNDEKMMAADNTSALNAFAITIADRMPARRTSNHQMPVPPLF
ncbi:hypothetical protein [Intrasporangium sp.]|uniref:hypothetical protein n=1 Tax=Intrasporangium sp. TaxID=1925024 RepID=UPI0033655E5E